MVGQRSTFTIHPRPTEGNAIPQLLADPSELVRYEIPAASKERLWHDLQSLGVDQQTLFADLEGLSRQIVHESGVIAYTPPQPPECSGPAEPA